MGLDLARQPIETGRTSVGRHHGAAFHARVRHVCSDLDALRDIIDILTRQIENTAQSLPLAVLLTSIPGLGSLTAARIIAAVENPTRFRNAHSFAAYVGVVPRTRLSGLHRPVQAHLSPIGNSPRLGKALWMPVLSMVRYNPWLRDYYQRLRARGKHPKVALVASMRKLLTAIYSIAKHEKPFAHPNDDSASRARPQST